MFEPLRGRFCRNRFSARCTSPLQFTALPDGATACHPPPRRGGRTTSSQFHGFRSPLANSTRGYNRRPRRGRNSFHRAKAATVFTTPRLQQYSPRGTARVFAPKGPQEYSPRRGWNRSAQGKAQRRPGWSRPPRDGALKGRNNTRPEGAETYPLTRPFKGWNLWS